MRLIHGIGICAMVGLVAACGSRTPESAAAPETSAPPSSTPQATVNEAPVQVAHPTRGAISAYYETTSRIQAETHVDVVSKGIGRCISASAEEGDHVEAGQILAELDKSEAEAALNQAEVQVRQAKTKYEVSQKSAREGFLAPVEADYAKFAYEQALAARKVQDLQMKNLTVAAPFAGTITKKNIQVGTLVMSGTPVYTIVDPASYELIINPPEKLLPRLKLDQVAKVALDAVHGIEFAAKVKRINPSVDGTSGTVKVTLGFDDKTLKQLKEGAFARVRLIVDTKDSTLLIPKDTITEENARRYVFITKRLANDPTPKYVAERVEITTGLEDSNSVEVLSGLSEASEIVTLGQEALKNGTPIRITDAAQELAAYGTASYRDANPVSPAAAAATTISTPSLPEGT